MRTISDVLRGAEAVVKKTKIIDIAAVIKQRFPKTYRVKELDNSLRKTRTRIEARLLQKAKLAGVLCPAVLEVDAFSIALSYISGKRPIINPKIAKKIGSILAKLHASEIVHGDFTPANLLISGRELYVIDFGLGFFSSDIEDKAIDVYTMLKSIQNEKSKSAFLESYRSYEKSKQVFSRLKDIEKRVRYAF